MQVTQASDALIAAGGRLGQRGLISGGEGNLSIRLDADRLLTSPTGRRKDELEPDDLVIVWLDHPERDATSASGLRPSSDLAIHLALYRARPDIAAVVHAHLPASMALTLAGERPDPTVLPETAYHLPRLPVVAAGEMGSADVAERVAAALSEPPTPHPNVAILERHGAYAVGGDLTAAVDRLELVEVLCRTWRDSLLIRSALVTLGKVSSD